MFGRSFNDIGNAINSKLIDFNDEFERTGNIASSWKNTDSIWKRLYGDKNEFAWIKNATGDIITNDNIDSLIPQISIDSAKNTAANIVDWNNEIKAGNKSWQDYFETLGRGEQYIVDVVKNTNDLSKLTGADLVRANQEARRAAIAHNEALKQQTLSAKAATLGLKALSIAGNMLLSMGISMAISATIKGIDYLIHRQEKLKEALDESISALEGTTLEIEELEKQSETCAEKIAELQKLKNAGIISIADEKELEKLKKENDELERQIVLLKDKQIREGKETLKKTKKQDDELVKSRYSLGNNVRTDEEINYAAQQFLYARNTGNEALQTEASDRIVEMYEKIQPTLEAYRALEDAGYDLSDSEKERYEQLKNGEQTYLLYLYWIRGTKDEFAALNEETQKNVLLGNLMKKGLSREQADAVMTNIKPEDYVKIWESDFKFTPPDPNDYESAEEYGKAYAEAWLNGLKDGVSDAGDKATASLSDFEKVSDNIGKLSSAYKELSDDGYITIKTINEIKEATGLSGDEWAEYETKLLNAKKGSAEFNQVMSDLTYKMIENQVSVGDLTNATDEEVKAIENKIAATLRENGVTNASAVAHDYVRMARVNEAIAAYDGTQASYDSASALISESLSADQAKIAMNQLEIAKRMVNSQQIKTASDIDEIIALANAAGASTQMLQDLARAKSELADGFVRPASPTTQKILDGEYTPTFNKLNPFDYKVITPKYVGGKSSGGSSKSSSDKNDALDNYLEDAERRYKIHQDETKYINDLDYALSKLVKTEEERRDVLDEIEQARKDYADNQVKDLEHIIEMTQNLKGENVDVLEYYNQIQDIAHNEADRLRSIGYDDNSDEIQEWQSKWWDIQDKKMDFYSKQHDNIISDIEHARDMALAKNPYVDTTSYYKQMQEEYHKLAELYRSIDSEKYAKEIQELQQSWWDAQQSIVDWRWENSQNWINQRNAYNDWALFGDSEIKAWERVVNWLNADYPEALDKIREAEQSLYEARKNEFSKVTDLTSSYYDSQKSLLQFYYDVTNSVAEAQHDIAKELEASKTMYEYLNEETRQLLFNQEDYNVLSEELYDIQYKADKLQRQYQYDLENATLDTIEEITSNYEMQYETLMKSYEIAKAELEVAKKRQKLDNVLNERNVRMFIDGQWQWVANTQDVIDAQSELADAEYARKTAEAEAKQTASINNLTKQQNELSTVISKFESGVTTLDEAVGYVATELGNLPSAIYSALNNVVSSSRNSKSSSSSGFNSAKAWIPGWGDVSVETKNGRTVSEVPYGTVVYTNGGKYKITGGEAGNYTSVKIDDEYATGSGNTRAGNILVGEKEPEVLVTKYGNLIPVESPTLFTNMQAGGKVFNGTQMQNLKALWDLSNNAMPNFDSIAIKTQNSVVNNDNSYHVYFQGVEIDNGIIDIDKLKRYVGNH